MSLLTNLADNGMIPDRLIRFGIRRLDRKRLIEEDRGNAEEQHRAIEEFIERMRNSPVAIVPQKASEAIR